MKKNRFGIPALLAGAAGLACVLSGVAQAQTYSSTTTPVAIPDNPTVVNTIDVSGFSGTLGDINVVVNITHTWNSDLDIILIPPSGLGTQYLHLATDVGGSADNFVNTVFDDAAATSITAGVAPFTGSFRPEGGAVTSTIWAPNTTAYAVANLGTAVLNLAGFNGINPNGTWTLVIDDDTGGDIGTLNSWSIVLSEGCVNTVSVAGTPAAGNAGASVPVSSVVTASCPGSVVNSVTVDASLVGGGTVNLTGPGAGNTWSGNVTIAGGTAAGTYNLPVTGTSGSTTGSGTIALTVIPEIPACPAGTIVAQGTNLNSSAPVGDVNNGVITNTVSGAGVVNAIRISGLAEEINEATFASEARVRVTAPSGAFYDFQFTTATPFPIADDFLSVASQELIIPAESANGLWSVEVFESFDDGGPTSVDALWRGLCVSAANISTPPIVSNIATSNSTIVIGGSPSSTVVTAQVSPGSLPASTNLQVSINGAPAGLGTIAMNDSGIAPDATPGDGIWSATLDSAGANFGTFSLAVTASDDELRSGTANFSQTIDVPDETGELPATANLAPSASTFDGRLNTGTDVDMWKIFICDPAAFSATTVGGITVPGTATGSDTALYLFSPDGNGISYNDDVSATNFNSLLANTQVSSLSAGEYYLAVAYFGNRPTNASSQTIWSELAPTTTVPPTGLGAPGPVADWNGTGTVVANYTLTLTGVSLTACGPVCNDIDINNDGASFDPTDIDAFLSIFSEGPCIPAENTCDGIDFNNDGALFDPCDIDAFLLVFSEGPCTLCGV